MNFLILERIKFKIFFKILKKRPETIFFRVIKSKQEVYDIVTRSFLRKENWLELATGKNLRTSWNLIWTWSKPNIEINKLLVW
jgi:hypothetical protein